MQSRSIILKYGHVIDPRNAIDEPRDLLIRAGRIAAVEQSIVPPPGAIVIDVSGLNVTPGIVDIHTHLYATTGIPDAWAGDNSVLPDGFSFRSGTTTMVDAGSSGWKNFPHFKATVIDRTRTRLFAFLNIASFGMMTELAVQDEEVFDAARTAAMAAAYPGLIVGIKTAHYRKPDWTAVERAVEAGERSGLPAMVDFGYFVRERPYWKLVGEKLRPGDISTHCYRGTVPVVDEQGRLYGYLRKARDRGVRFDLGHGGGSFVFRNAGPAVRQGFVPDSISSDLHALSMNTGMMDMPTTMSKLLNLGMPLVEVIRHSTTVPAGMIGHPELGTLSPGAEADIAVWELREGRFGFADSAGGRLEGTKRLSCELTLKSGEVVWDLNARSAADFRSLGSSCGIREGAEFILKPSST
ncbi:MAG: amidohydrolase/deacetylase family metallohydrolase [Deltaproteobacteria bacterium]|nr:amidohydrolase/deacetylase family metallohydrolase [Deltaproteobacteria bacterium]